MSPTNADLQRLFALADAEANGYVSVGGRVMAMAAEGVARPAPFPERAALAKLVELRRRERQFTPEELAGRAGVDLVVVVAVERGELTAPDPRTIRALARALDLPEQKLLQLAGLAAPDDQRVREAAVRFAARSEPVEKLSPAEHQALDEFVKFLAGV